MKVGTLGWERVEVQGSLARAKHWRPPASVSISLTEVPFAVAVRRKRESKGDHKPEAQSSSHMSPISAGTAGPPPFDPHLASRPLRHTLRMHEADPQAIIELVACSFGKAHHGGAEEVSSIDQTSDFRRSPLPRHHRPAAHNEDLIPMRSPPEHEVATHPFQFSPSPPAGVPQWRLFKPIHRPLANFLGIFCSACLEIFNPGFLCDTRCHHTRDLPITVTQGGDLRS